MKSLSRITIAIAAGAAVVLFQTAAPAGACTPPERYPNHPACTTTTQPPTSTTASPETTTTVPETTTTVPETTTTVVDTTTSTAPTSTTWHGETSTTSPGPVLSVVPPPAPGPGEPRLAETGPRESGRLAALGLVLLLSGVAAVTYAAKRKAVAS